MFLTFDLKKCSYNFKAGKWKVLKEDWRMRGWMNLKWRQRLKGKIWRLNVGSWRLRVKR
jgi:hypothetical protein